MKTLAYIVSGILTLLILVVVVAPFFLDLNDYKGDIAAAVKDATGRDLAIDGDIVVSLVPLPTIRVAGVRFANLDGATAPDMVRIGVIEASVALTPLLSGNIKIDRLTFVNPVVELEVLGDGRANWWFEGADGGAAGDSNSLALRIDSLVIEGATLTYRDAVAGTVKRIENLDLEAVVDSIKGPFRATGSLVAQLTSRAIPLAFEVQVGALDQRPLPLRVYLTLSDADATVTFNGSASSASSDAELSGKLKVAGGSLARLISSLSGGGSAANPLLGHAFSLNASIAASTVTAGINDMVFDLGGIQGTGAVSALLADEPQVDVAIALNHVDLDKLLASAAVPEPAGDSGDTARPFTLPDDIYATLDLRIDAVVYNQSVVRQAALVAALDQGVVTVQQASALLPGGSDVTVFGVLDFPDGRHHFDGQVEASADNLRAVFDWLNISAGGVPADRLRKLSLSTKVDITPTLVKVSGIDLRVDSSRFTGAANIGLGPRLAFNAIVALDQINLDAYMPGAAAGDSDGDDPLALLGDFDAELKAKVGKLVYNGLPLSDVALDAGLRRGVLSIRSLRIDDLAGAGVTLAGTIDSAAPGFDLTYSVNAADAVRLFQLAGVAPPGGNLGGVVIHGSAKGDMAAVTLDTTITLSDAEARFAGALDGLAGTPRVDATISLRADSLALLARRFGTNLPDTAHTPIVLDGTVKGDAAAATVAVTVAALGADLRLEGSLVNLLAAPAYDLAISLDHPNFVAFAESLGDDMRFARRDLGKVQISATVTGDGVAAKITDLRAELGPSRLSGVMAIRFDGARPSIDADIAAGEIHADLFQVVATTGTGTGTTGASGASSTTGAAGTATGRWSRQAIDFSGLGAVDATARVTATALIFRKYRFEDVALRLALAGGVLDIEELSGRLYGAPAKLRARLTDTAPPTVALALTLQGADLKAVLIDAAEVDAASGKLDLTARFETRGRSEAELISALGGNGTVAVRQGMIEGIDLGRLNSQLANIDNEIALIGLIGGALSGGATPIHSLDGSFSASNGVIRSSDIRAVLDGGEGSAVATIDLPRWQLSVNSEFRLTGHPNAPPVGVLLMGSIDNPQREIRDEALRAHLAEKVFNTVARKVLAPAIAGQTGLGGLLEAITGGGQNQPQQEAAPTEGDPIPAPPAPSPEQLFENLLRGIIQGN